MFLSASSGRVLVNSNHIVAITKITNADTNEVSVAARSVDNSVYDLDDSFHVISEILKNEG